MMKVLEDYKGLVGKKIIFSHMAQFAKQITLATEDGYVLMATFDYEEMEEETRIRVMHKYSVIATIQREKYIREQLAELGIFDLEAYQKEIAEEQRKRLEEQARKKEERDFAEYKRLKDKYESE